VNDVPYTDTLTPVWELLDVHAETARVLAALTGGAGTEIHLLGAPHPIPVASFEGESVRLARFDRSGGRILTVVEAAGGRQRVVILDQQLPSKAWSVAGTFELMPGSVLDLDPEHGILFAVSTNGSEVVDVVLLDPEGRNQQQVYSGGWAFSGSLSPNGTEAALLRVAEGRLDTELLMCRVGTDEPPRELLAHAAPVDMGRPCWTPDAASLLISTNAERDHAGIARVNVRTGQWSYVWRSESDAEVRLTLGLGAVLVDENIDGASRIFRVGPHGRETVPLDPDRPYLLPGRGVVHLMARPVVDRNGWLYCTFTDHARAASVWRLSVDAPAQQLSPIVATGTTDGGWEQRPPERIFIRAADGVTVPVLLWSGRPDGPLQQSRASVVLLHGGPRDQWRRRFHSLINALRMEGLAILTPDLRGSIGFGKSYSALGAGIHHLDAQRDLEAVHTHLADLGLDPRGSVLIGSSFGGYQALTALTRPDSPWAGGVVVSGVSDPVSYLESVPPYRRTQREFTYGSLHDNNALLRHCSPLSNADALHVPLLLVHGERDAIVPLAQAQAMVAAIGAVGGDVSLSTFPDEGHRFQRPHTQAALTAQVTEFVRTKFQEARSARR